MVQWTKEQEKAIYTAGTNILVAAAAGSGKTAVLVERIIQKLLDKEEPVDIDSLLVVTFTNAAAQEMRNRVGGALEKALEAEPNSVHLKKQLSLLQRASISTLHSFCLDVIRQYAYLLDIDPSFRIGDDMEMDLIKQDVLDDLFEDWYGDETGEVDEFFAVVDRFSSDRSDVDVEELILKLYTFAVQNPWPEAWLDDLAESYHIPEDWEEDDLNFLPILRYEMKNTFTGIREQMERAMAIARESDGPDAYIDTINSDIEGLHGAEERMDSWGELVEWIGNYKFARLSSKKMDCNEEKKEAVKALRDQYKKSFSDIQKKWLSRPLERHIAEMQEMYPVIKKLTELVKAFKTAFTKAKREKALVDFSDLEHYCLELLLDGAADAETLVPSRVALEFQAKFTEVLVDEYQDTNHVQETIIQMVSKREEPGNTFMVGDVKQSVYRFRHAEPGLFLEKYKRYREEEAAGKRIDLARNFRSREEVLDASNYIFRQIIDEALGEIEYGAAAELIYGNKSYDDVPSARPEAELILIDGDKEVAPLEGETEESENFRDLEKAQIEGRAYAELIKKWIGRDGEAFPVVDKETGVQRPAQYRDIVILLRGMKQAPVIVEELKQHGIPVYADISEGYFEAIEIKIMISLLKVIDNPHQDIPLASVLRSPIVGLNEDELTQIRMANRQGSYYEALGAYVKTNQHPVTRTVSGFLQQLQEFRRAARDGALSELIWDVYRETGYYDFVGGMPGGRQRQANLRALYDRARGYESTSFRGLFRFLRFIERMEEEGKDLGAARALSEQEDVVRIMTIHKSKGLEFPIVIVGMMDKQFNLRDLNEKYLLDKTYGFATKFIDPVKRLTYTTLFYEAVKMKKLREQLAEEMRVLYVALTRAKEKLVMTGYVRDLQKRLDNWDKMLDHQDWVLPEYYRLEKKSYLDWVGPALIRHDQNEILRTRELPEELTKEIREDRSKWEITIIHARDLTNLGTSESEEKEQLKHHIEEWKPVSVARDGLQEYVDERLHYNYPDKEATMTRAKQTVTEIKRQRELFNEYGSDQLISDYRPPIMKRPNFLQKEQTLSAAEKGTAMHTVMQHLPLTRALTTSEITEEVERLVEKEILTRAEADIIDIAAIEYFYETPLATYMMEMSELYREVPFSLMLKAEEIYPEFDPDKNEEVLIQGVIDCLIPKDDGWIILDYKTDTISEPITPVLEEKLKKRYEVQLSLYRAAVERIWNQPVKETYLYFFEKQLFIQVSEG
ncbi:helicase-exonuclease AddAB subunit AddA [Oceanobacillus alkalisoli]|uniref:helicase-exonuclease AddAB subunit AddA n=1 Tax=Oceanobacillus alkalisoli TaxID=2925113 RepID=UPI001EF0297C|nr:helicase-exonuclease AddAB subunit AddA [Oceanobacillus alkalisoli]MCF3942051.1 helicase-exonuclease AddAB subunit AddA [Oceanobacillus alkalisoli]MCG5101996.1 helicase-exonuclease AddAB subunit AddA [Oceanobacillus alkalisoli]